MKTIKVTIVSAEKELYSGDVTFFAGTAVTGEIGVYPGHVPTLAMLKPGQVRLTLEGDKEEVFWISGGLLEVQPTQIIVLADSAERAGDLDLEAAQKAKAEADKMMSSQDKEFDSAQAQMELNIAKSQLDAINRLKSL